MKKQPWWKIPGGPGAPWRMWDWLMLASVLFISAMTIVALRLH